MLIFFQNWFVYFSLGGACGFFQFHFKNIKWGQIIGRVVIQENTAFMSKLYHSPCGFVTWAY